MGYQFKHKETVEGGVVRMAREQAGRAVAELQAADIAIDERIHQVRKRFKKIRAIVRLVRDELGKAYARENIWYRDKSRKLAEARDAAAMLETLAKLRRQYDRSQLSTTAYETVRTLLTNECQRRMHGENNIAVMARLREELDEAGKRIMTWPLKKDGYGLVVKGFKRTYKRGRKAFAVAYAVPTDENVHEWRKRVKYHWYHIRMFQRIWPDVMKGLRKSLKTLSDLLGEDHDLALLCAYLEETCTCQGAEDE
ncbi:MAG: CHAD domain-containing protein, partial [Candidatus Pacebacteria bacterium]|nr:CHAD domain-containing protein [Candidatus Paceibacterota bacterium]